MHLCYNNCLFKFGFVLCLFVCCVFRAWLLFVVIIIIFDWIIQHHQFILSLPITSAINLLYRYIYNANVYVDFSPLIPHAHTQNGTHANRQPSYMHSLPIFIFSRLSFQFFFYFVSVFCSSLRNRNRMLCRTLYVASKFSLLQFVCVFLLLFVPCVSIYDTPCFVTVTGMDIRKQKEKIYNKIDECREKKKSHLLLLVACTAHTHTMETDWCVVYSWWSTYLSYAYALYAQHSTWICQRRVCFFCSVDVCCVTTSDTWSKKKKKSRAREENQSILQHFVSRVRLPDE